MPVVDAKIEIEAAVSNALITTIFERSSAGVR